MSSPERPKTHILSVWSCFPHCRQRGSASLSHLPWPTTIVQNGWSETGCTADGGKCHCAVARPDPPNNSREEARLHLQTLNLKTLRHLLDPVGFAQLLPTAIRGFSLVIYYNEERGGVLPSPTTPQPPSVFRKQLVKFSIPL